MTPYVTFIKILAQSRCPSFIASFYLFFYFNLYNFCGRISVFRQAIEDEEMLHQSFSKSELEGHRQHQTRQLFMGEDSLQISQSGERLTG